jgi:Uma2 family endonuclease
MADLRIADLEQLLREGIVKLEITGGVPTWEVSPGSRHQRMVYLIQTSISPTPDSDQGCACAHLSDVYMRFADGSLKRPDIAIFSEEPPDQDEALATIPRAVVEVISPGYEYKDTTLNPQFYLAQGVGDVIVVDPRSGIVNHYRMAEVSTHHAPVTINLQCGCQCTVPRSG